MITRGSSNKKNYKVFTTVDAVVYSKLSQVYPEAKIHREHNGAMHFSWSLSFFATCCVKI